jgi:hypothetical protein
MTKSVVVKKFLSKNKYVIYPLLKVKDSGSFAIPPYIEGYDLCTEELFDKILHALTFSREENRLAEDSKVGTKEFLKAMGVKTMKALHEDTINLSIYVKENVIEFMPWKNAGSKQGFIGFKENLSTKLPFNSPREELLKALELTLSRCR